MAYKSKFPLGVAISIYGMGSSAEQVSVLIGWSFSHVNRTLKRAGVRRTLAEAARIRWPEESVTSIRHGRAISRRKMEHVVGRKLGRKEHVHHKDEDPTNTDLDNLEIMSAGDHLRHHNKKWDIPVWKRPHTIEYGKVYYKTKTKQEKTCPVCKVVFKTNKYHPGKTCTKCRNKKI